MDAATRYARQYLLTHPALVVLRAPTGYLKTSTTRIAAQRAPSSAIVDCREVSTQEDVQLALRRRTAPVSAVGAVDDFIAFENADAAVDRPEVLAAIHDAIVRRGPRQTIAVCARHPFPLPPAALADAVQLTHDDLAVDVADELAGRGLSGDRIDEIRALTLGWPMPTYRLAAIAASVPAGRPIVECASRAYDRLLQDVRLDFVDRLPAHRWDAAREARRDALADKLAHADGILLRDGAAFRVPGILVAAAESAGGAATPSEATAAPRVLFDVVSGDVSVGGTPVQLPRREYEVFVNLAIKGRHVPYDVLIEEIWGDAGDDHAKLKVTVGRLRKRLGFGTVRSIDAGYVIGENVSCTLAELQDLARLQPPFAPETFERLEALCARHARGARGIARNWPWYTAWSAKIDAFVEHAVVAIGHHALERHRFGIALERANDAIALNAVSQDAHELALRALLAQGNVVAARQLLASYAGELRRALGIAPPESITRLVTGLAS